MSEMLTQRKFPEAPRYTCACRSAVDLDRAEMGAHLETRHGMNAGEVREALRWATML